MSLPPGLQKRVDAHLREYLSHKAKSSNGVCDPLFSKTSSDGSICTDEGLFEQPELGPQIQVAMEKVFWLRSVQLHTDQQAWQVQYSLLFDLDVYHDFLATYDKLWPSTSLKHLSVDKCSIVHNL